MEKERIAALLEKYWQAGTTVEEEKELTEYFRGPDLPPEWEPYRNIFSFYEEEAQIKSSPALEARIMAHIRPRRQRTMWWAAAAVIILGLGLSIFFKDTPAPGIKDTYDDPQQALAAVQKALFTASRKINKGLHPLK